jgi:hypothetical protein
VGIGNSTVASTKFAVTGTVVGANIETTSSTAAHEGLIVNRQNSDGIAIAINKAGTTAGIIASDSSSMLMGSGDVGVYFDSGSDRILPMNMSTLGVRNDAIDIGGNPHRFKDLYLSGGVYVGGTGSANHLDDYEEGTFTTTMTPTSSGSITLNGTYDELHYVKIGKLVTVTGYLVVSSVSSPVGAVSIGMPFTHENVGTNQSSIQMSWNGVASGTINDAWGIISPNTNYVNVYVGTGTGAQIIFAQRVGSGTDLRICATFMTT